MATFSRNSSLPNTGCQETDFYTLVETLTPSADLVLDSSGLRLASGTSGALAAAYSTPYWRKYTLTKADFTTANSNLATIFTLPDGGIIHGVRVRHTVAFSSTTLTLNTASISVGTTANTAKYAAPIDVLQPPADNLYRLNMSGGGETFSLAGAGAGRAIVAFLDADAPGEDMDAGTVQIWVLWSMTEI